MPLIAPYSDHDRRALAAMGRATFWTLTVIAVPACALTTLAYFASSPAFLAQLSPFRPQYLVLLAAHALFCLALRRRRWAALFAGLAAFNLWAVLHTGSTDAPTPALAAYAAPAHGDDRPSPAPEPAPAPLKVLFANVLTSNEDQAPLLALIEAEQPDLVALLEINARWQARLSAALLESYPHAFFRSREDNFGLAVFSRRPPLSGRVEFFADVETPSFDFNLEHGAAHLRVLVTHPLPPGDADNTRLRDQHLGDLIKWSRFVAALTPADAPTPVLILGDFNATPWCPPLRRLLAAAALRPAARDHTSLPRTTWPVPIPFLRIPLDHALLNPALICTAYRIGPDIGSDHYPLILEVQLAR